MLIKEQELRQEFHDRGYAGIVSLIDYITAQEKLGVRILKIGTETIYRVPGPHFRKRDLGGGGKLHGFYFGTQDGSRLPLEAIAELTQELLGYYLPDGNCFIDAICADLAQEDELKYRTICSRSMITEQIN